MAEKRVAAIQDKNGGFRVVVSDGCLYCHLTEKERIFITPFTVDGGPIQTGGDDRIGVIEAAINYAKAEMIEDNLCGGCTFCCRAPAIDVLDKPAGAMCKHQCGGCKLQQNKPLVCRVFECDWLKSQKGEGLRMSPELRPDRCGVMFVRRDDVIEIHAENEPERLEQEPVKSFLRDKKTYFVTHYHSKLPPTPKPRKPIKSLVGIVYFADDPDKKIFRWVYPERDDMELDRPPTHGDGSIMCDEKGEPYSWATLPPGDQREAVMEKIPASDPRAHVNGW